MKLVFKIYVFYDFLIVNKLNQDSHILLKNIPDSFVE